MTDIAEAIIEDALTNPDVMNVLLREETAHGDEGYLGCDFEHGQWWLTHNPTGAQWSVVDTDRGFDFERVSDGDVA